MTNEHDAVFQTPDDDEVSGKIDGLDKAMETDVETLEDETLGMTDVDPGIGGTYTVQPGDDLRRIAERFYGSSEDYKRIIDANEDALRGSEVRPGLKLKIPRAA